MVYNGLEFGTFFEVLPTSPCYQILKGVNPVLQMIFTFMQMYFIFMNSRVCYPYFQSELNNNKSKVKMINFLKFILTAQHSPV